MVLAAWAVLGGTIASAQPFAYVANYDSDNVSVIDTATNTVVDTVGVGDEPRGIAITPDGSRAYVTNYGSDNVSVIDTATNTVMATVVVGSYPDGIAITPDGSRAYVVFDPNNLSVIDTATNTVVATVGVGSDPGGIAITPDGSRAYVANELSSNVSVIDTATNTVVATVEVGSWPIGIAITPDGSRVYVANYSYTHNNVSVIDTATNTVVSTVGVGGNPIGIAITPDGSRAYVTNIFTDNVSVIDTATNTVVGTVGVGVGPFGIAITPESAGFSDDFTTDTTGDYTQSGSGTLAWDGTNERACVTTTGGTDLSFSHDLPAATEGAFSIDLRTLARTGPVGEIELRLYENTTTYYKIINRNGGTKTGGINKFINGVRVDKAWFSQKYAQGKDYTIRVEFTPSSTVVRAFGQTLTINSDNSPITVRSFTLKTKKQNACYDNIEYRAEGSGSSGSSSSSSSSSSAPSGDFTDRFDTDTTGDYAQSGNGAFIYDSVNHRACVATRRTTDLSFSHDLPAAAEATFSVDVRTLEKTGRIGEIELRLYENANTFYKIINRSGGTRTGGINKFVNGVRVDKAWFSKQYEQGKDYSISVNFSAGITRVEAFGQVLTIGSDRTPITVNLFRIKTKHQNACYDNIEYNIGVAME